MSTDAGALPPPVDPFSLRGWLRANLFQSWFNVLLTLLSAAAIFVVLRALVLWVLNSARFGLIGTNIRLLLVGQYPLAYSWRIWVCVGMFAALIGLAWGIWLHRTWLATLPVLLAPFALALLGGDAATRLAWIAIGAVGAAGIGLGVAGRRFKPLRQFAVGGWLAALPLTIGLLRGWGTSGPLTVVPTNVWGGLLLSLLLASVGIVLSFPLGVLLALGRQSRLPVVRIFSVVYIETIRAVPLITLLFMAQAVLPLFVSEAFTPDRLVRAMAAVTLFNAAYMAENVRGGLQAVGRGQYEAGAAIGLSRVLTLRLIVLPQALRAIIPVITAHCIGAVRDTSLVVIVGLLDLLGIARSVLAQPANIGRNAEMYLFLAGIYWLISIILSYIGQRAEAAANPLATR